MTTLWVTDFKHSQQKQKKDTFSVVCKSYKLCRGFGLCAAKMFFLVVYLENVVEASLWD